jgi:ABC-type sugar transport system ATPase subunit
MSVVSVENVYKVYPTSNGPMTAVRGVTLDCRDGETLAVLGPSGSGKSSLMRMIAGLEHVSAGRIVINGEVVNNVPPERRAVSLAFENYALYPALTVRQNLEFPLKNFRQHTPKQIKERVDDIAGHFGLSQVLDRKPAELSGGHRQMVSLGRALIKPAAVHILDEPLSHLDLQFRNQVVAKLKTLQRERRLSMILITHDQAEALELADRVAVINDGLLQQIGTPSEIVDQPANLFVAGFVGEPPMNFVPCALRHGEGLVTKKGGRFEVPRGLSQAPAAGDLVMGVRPGQLTIADKVPGSCTFSQPLPLVRREQLGEISVLTVDFEGQPLSIVVRRREERMTQGDKLLIGYRPEALHLFSRETGVRVAVET